MKSSSRQRRVRSLKAKATTAHPDTEFDNYGAEPNMKLSHAFMVVLALHVVAVGGLFAFNKVKTSRSKVSEKLQTEVVATEESKPLVAAPVDQTSKEVKREATLKTSSNIVETSVALSKAKEQKVPIIPKKIATVPVLPTPTATRSAFLATKTEAPSITGAPSVSSSAAVAAVATMASSTRPTAAPITQSESVESMPSIEYTIIKGDNPYKIAKRFHVSYSQLIKFNDISDPRKMQIGQKIKIPGKQ